METEKVFRRALRALGGPRRPRSDLGGRWVLVPPSPEYPILPRRSDGRRPTAAERRNRNLTYLAGFIVVTFLLGLLLRPLRFLLVANVVADLLLVAYILAAVFVAARPPKRSGRPGPAGARPTPESAPAPDSGASPGDREPPKSEAAGGKGW